MRQATVSAQPRLVVVPIPEDVGERDVVDAMCAFLDGHIGVPRCAAFVTWDEGGRLLARDIELAGADEAPDSTHRTIQCALASLLGELFSTTVRASWDGVAEFDAGDAHLDELSMSFLREVHDFVTPKTSFVALLTDWVDPGAIVGELRHLQGLRVIYGRVPQHWAANSA